MDKAGFPNTSQLESDVPDDIVLSNVSTTAARSNKDNKSFHILLLSIVKIYTLNCTNVVKEKQKLGK